MDLQALETGRETLLDGMRSRGYSESYIRQHDRMAAFLLENNCDAWESSDDALAAYGESGASASQMHVARSVLFGLERFCAEGALPGDGCRRRAPEGTCYDRLNDRFRQVVDVDRKSTRLNSSHT